MIGLLLPVLTIFELALQFLIPRAGNIFKWENLNLELKQKMNYLGIVIDAVKEGPFPAEQRVKNFKEVAECLSQPSLLAKLSNESWDT